jgi:hypothetical protein
LAEIPGGVEDLMKELLKVTNTSRDKIASNITESHDVAAKDSNARILRPRHTLGPKLTKQRPMTCVAIAVSDAPGKTEFLLRRYKIKTYSASPFPSSPSKRPRSCGYLPLILFQGFLIFFFCIGRRNASIIPPTEGQPAPEGWLFS